MCTLKPIFAAGAAVLSCGAAHAVPQAYVHTDGSDANMAQGRAVDRPYRTFAAALGVVDDGGDVVALGSGEYGPARIKQSVSIIGNGAAGILVTGNGVGVDIVAPDVTVVLRGLSIRSGINFGVGVQMKDGS